MALDKGLTWLFLSLVYERKERRDAVQRGHCEGNQLQNEGGGSRRDSVKKDRGNETPGERREKQNEQLER